MSYRGVGYRGVGYRAWGAALWLVLLGFVCVPPLSAQNTTALVRILNSGGDFRTRVQAAFALGNLGSESAVPALSRGLRDRHPAVRAASATALGRIGSARARRALERARNDSSAAVRTQVEQALTRLAPAPAPTRRRTPNAGPRGIYPAIAVIPSADRIAWPRVRYVVTLGDLENSSGFRGDGLEGVLRRELSRQLRVLRGVAVLPSADALDAQARREIRRRHLPQLQLNGRIANVRRSRRGRDLSIRCEVSLMLLDQGSIRGELRGAATGTAPQSRSRRSTQERELAERALSGAVRSAVSNAREAIAEAVTRR